MIAAMWYVLRAKLLPVQVSSGEAVGRQFLVGKDPIVAIPAECYHAFMGLISLIMHASYLIRQRRYLLWRAPDRWRRDRLDPVDLPYHLFDGRIWIENLAG